MDFCMLEKIFKIKGIDQMKREVSKASKDESLKRVLKLGGLIALGLGAVIGSGIFVTAGIAAAGSENYAAAGPSVMVSFVVVAIACLFCVFCYAELASVIPIAGGAYTYTYATFGEYAAWIMACNIILEYMLGNVAVAISWSGYFNAILKWLGIGLPDWAVTSSMIASPEVWASAPCLCGIPIVCNIPAVAIVFLTTCLLVRGIRESSNVNNFLVVLKIVIILAVIGLGAAWVNPGNWVPFAPGGFAGIQAGASIIFFSYIGFDFVATVSEEAENPQRDLSRAMIITLAVSTLLYALVAAVLTGMAKYTLLGTADPMATAFRLVGMPKAAAFISIGAVVCMTAVLISFQIAQPRVWFVVARDKLLPPFFAKVHAKYKTPYVTTIFIGLLVTLGAGFLDLTSVVALCNVGAIFCFILVCLEVIVLRHRQPDLERPFRTPLVPWVPIGGILFCIYLALGVYSHTWVYYAVWIVVCTLIYSFYGYRHGYSQHVEIDGAAGDGEIESGPVPDQVVEKDQ